MLRHSSRLACLASFGFGICLALAALVLLGGCAGTPRWGDWSRRPTPAQTLAALAWEDDYVYFPGYEIYYNRTQGCYVYWDGRRWVNRVAAPREINVATLLASPSVAVSFHGSPERHHAAMVLAYPRHWGLRQPLVAGTR